MCGHNTAANRHHMLETAPPPPKAALAIRLFGPFEVRLDAESAVRFGSRKAQWILALLILRQGREVERSWLAGTLWPDSPESEAYNSLRNALTELRRALGAESCRLLSPTPRSLRFDLTGVEADVNAFDMAVERGDPESLE